MRTSLRMVAVPAAVVLAGSVLTGAFAKGPVAVRDLVRQQTKHYTVNGSLQVNDVLKVKKNDSVYGALYAHDSAQIWKGLLVRNGLKVDTINNTGPLQAQSATITNALQAGAMSGTSIATTGDANIGGSLAAHGKVTANGVDAGAGGLTTSGTITGSTLTSNGALAVTGATTLSGGLTVSGSVNFSNANITGLNVGNINLNLSGATANSFTVGTPSSTAAPLNVSANGHTAAVGVTSGGALSTDSIATNSDVVAGGNFIVHGSGGVTSNLVTAPLGSDNTLGALTLQGSTVSLNGTLNFNNHGDINLSQASGAASHVNANGDTDVSGTLAVTIGNSAGTFTNNYTYIKPYAKEPAVTVTPNSDLGAGDRYWVTPIESNNQYTGFTLHVATTTAPANSFNGTFYYVVLGR